MGAKGNVTMSTLDARSILSDATGCVTPFSRTHGASPDALATSVGDDASQWDDAIERMLAWRSNPGQFNEEDEPSIQIIETAIDFAVDERTSGGPAPMIIIPSGDGKVAFEWHYRRSTMIIEFVDRGRAKYTKFVDGRVIEKGELNRNPETRKMELGG